MYSTEEVANEIELVNNDLVMADVEVIESGSLPVKASTSNSVSQMKLFDLSDNINTGNDLSGMWWCRVHYADDTYSKFTKVRWYDEENIYLARDLNVVPADGDTLEYWAIAFHDTRADEFKLGCVHDEVTDEYEVILWDDLQWDGSKFQIIGVTRQVEDSASVNATGKKFSYYPSIGPGSTLIVVPASTFIEVDADTFKTTFEVDITLPATMGWGAMTAMFGRNTVKNNISVIARSPIVLCRYGGEG